MNLTNYLVIFDIHDQENELINDHEIALFTDNASKCINNSVFFAIKGINND